MAWPYHSLYYLPLLNAEVGRTAVINAVPPKYITIFASLPQVISVSSQFCLLSSSPLKVLWLSKAKGHQDFNMFFVGSSEVFSWVRGLRTDKFPAGQCSTTLSDTSIDQPLLIHPSKSASRCILNTRLMQKNLIGQGYMRTGGRVRTLRGPKASTFTVRCANCTATGFFLKQSRLWSARARVLAPNSWHNKWHAKRFLVFFSIKLWCIFTHISLSFWIPQISFKGAESFALIPRPPFSGDVSHLWGVR